MEVLDLRHNLLRELPGVKNELESWFPSLHTLDVSNNKLEVSEGGIGGVRRAGRRGR